jgi:hypothetical protein
MPVNRHGPATHEHELSVRIDQLAEQIDVVLG